MLMLAALFAVIGAVFAGAALRPAQGAAAVEPARFFQVCKNYEATGSLNDTGRVFHFFWERSNIDGMPAGYEETGYLWVEVDEGGQACTETVEVEGSSNLTVRESLSYGFASAPGFPVATFDDTSTVADFGTADEVAVELDAACDQELEPCVIGFTNKADPDASYLTVCKTYEPTGPLDDMARDFIFLIDLYEGADGTNFLYGWNFILTVDEGETACTGPMAIPTDGYVTVGEGNMPGWYQANYFTHNGVHGAVTPSPSYYFQTGTTCQDQSCVLTFINREGGEVVSTEPAEGDNSIIVCKYYEQGGPLDDYGREFDFSLYIDEAPLGNADVIHDFSIMVDEGQSNCTDAMQVPANATIGVHEIGSAGFTNHPDYPQYELIQDGQEADFGQESLFFFNNENDCQPEMPCVVNFFNKPVEEAEYPIRICKTLVDNGDGYQRPDTTFMFNANWTQTTITVAEGETDCVVVWAEPSPDNGILTVSEVLIPGFEQAPGFMKRKLDTYPVQSTPDMGIHAGSILLKLDDGCYEPYLEIEGGLDLVRSVLSVVTEETTEPFICTVYFFNQEVPNDGPECEVDCGEPECEVGCGSEPECEVDCEPPCAEDCGEPECQVSCDEPQCIDCDEPTPTPETPTVPNEPQTTPEPEKEVEGETTPGPQATPKAPDTGSSVEARSRSHAPLLAMVSAVLLLGSIGAGVAGVAVRRR